jgi:hypoxanthine phosphoribosyltransferase
VVTVYSGGREIFMGSSYSGDVSEVLITKEELAQRVEDLGQQITRDYQGKDLLLVGVLKGAFVFMVDLARAIKLPLEIDFMAVSSYGASTESSGVVRIIKDLDAAIEDKHILIVEDIIDTGLTLKYICENLKSRGPASLKICALINKSKTRKADIDVDYTGFQIPDKFIVGYGLDVAEVYRNLPHIAIYKPAEK